MTAADSKRYYWRHLEECRTKARLRARRPVVRARQVKRTKLARIADRWLAMLVEAANPGAAKPSNQGD